jgi:uncharacterized protein with GYD domain
MLFLQIAKHTAESCPMHNEKTKKLATDLMNKMGPLTKKYGVKVVGSWVSYPEHFMIAVYDAPNTEAMLKLSMEPEVMAFMGFNMTDMRPVMTLEEAMKLMK